MADFQRMRARAIERGKTVPLKPGREIVVILRRMALVLVAVALLTSVAWQTFAQPGPPFGRGRGGRGQGGDPQFAVDRDVFHFLLANHDQIRRQVTQRADGVETVTESDKPEIAAKIQEHVAAMHRRVVEVRPIHMRDPLFAEVFRHASQIEMKCENTKHGVKVIETSKDPYVAKLIQAHAQVVNGFVKNGFAEAQQNHAVPGTATAATKPADEPNALAACPCGKCAASPNAAAANSACKTCPNAATCPAGQACPAAAGAGCKACPNAAAANPACKNCPFSAPCPGGAACPAAKTDIDVPPPPNQAAKKS